LPFEMGELSKQKTVAFVRSMPLNRDSRSSKMLQEYQRRGFATMAVIWSRGEAVQRDDGYAACFTGAGGYGRRLGNLWVRLRWMAFAASYIWRCRKQIDAIHSVDLDIGIICVPMGRLLQIPVIYDAFDHMASFFPGGALSRLLAIVERWVIALSAIVILPDPARLKQYGIAESKRTLIIGNIPESLDAETKASISTNVVFSAKPNDPLHLVYVGTLEAEHRALEAIPGVCDKLQGKIRFSVAGVGFLEDFFSEQSMRRSNLHFAGHLAYHEAIKLMMTADCLYGPYLLTTAAHQYAVPNKMYEHLAFGKPLLTNSGTPVSNLVSREQSGFLFDGSENGLVAAIEQLTREECQRVGLKARAAWQRSYCKMRATQLSSYFSAFEETLEATK
jgi:glycosyltransferase involved in cell wall biosynthesis